MPPLEFGSATFTADPALQSRLWSYAPSAPGYPCDAPWAFSSTDQTVQIEFGLHGEYEVCLQAWDSVLQTWVFDRQWVTVANVAPVFTNAWVNPEPSMVGDPISQAWAQVDADPDSSCAVDYGDGAGPQPGMFTEATCMGPDHTYTSAGLYDVIFSLTEPDGLTGSTTVQHQVSAYLISGTVFYDGNGNGVLDGNDYIGGGWGVYLDQGCDGTADSDMANTTYPGGTYSFANLTAGLRYCVQYGGKNGYRQSTDPLATASLTADVTGFEVGIESVHLDYDHNVNLNGPVGAAYTRTLAVTGGDGPYDFSGTVWEIQPSGLDFTTDPVAGTLTIFGTPAAEGEGLISLAGCRRDK